MACKRHKKWAPSTPTGSWDVSEDVGWAESSGRLKGALEDTVQPSRGKGGPADRKDSRSAIGGQKRSSGRDDHNIARTVSRDARKQ